MLLRFLLPCSLLLSLALWTFACAPGGSCQCGNQATFIGGGQAAAHAWKVYDGDELVLDVSDSPGAILSTAALPPGVAPKQHPFLSASARSAAHESKLHDLLEASKSLSDFLKRLESAGYAVRPLPASK